MFGPRYSMPVASSTVLARSRVPSASSSANPDSPRTTSPVRTSTVG